MAFANQTAQIATRLLPSATRDCGDISPGIHSLRAMPGKPEKHSQLPPMSQLVPFSAEASALTKLPLLLPAARSTFCVLLLQFSLSEA